MVPGGEVEGLFSVVMVALTDSTVWRTGRVVVLGVDVICSPEVEETVTETSVAVVEVTGVLVCVKTGKSISMEDGCVGVDASPDVADDTSVSGCFSVTNVTNAEGVVLRSSVGVSCEDE